MYEVTGPQCLVLCTRLLHTSWGYSSSVGFTAHLSNTNHPLKALLWKADSIHLLGGTQAIWQGVLPPSMLEDILLSRATIGTCAPNEGMLLLHPGP